MGGFIFDVGGVVGLFWGFEFWVGVLFWVWILNF